MIKIKSFNTSFSALSLGYIILGLILLLFPSVSIKIICIALGIAALVIGIIKLVNYFQEKEEIVLLSTGFISGFLLAALGLFFIIKPVVVASILPFFIGLLICFNGIVKLQSAFDLHKVGYDKWQIPLLIAILTLILGVILIINPFTGAKLAAMVIGAVLIIDGVTNIATIQTVKKKVGDNFDFFDID